MGLARDLRFGAAAFASGLPMRIPEAARAVIEWAFQSYDIAKVFARADARNTQSFRVMEKLGMQREGQLRKHRHFRGEQVDEVVYGVLREEWPGQPER